MMDHSRFVTGCLLLIIPVVKSNHSPVRALIGSNVTLEWTEVQDIYNQPEYINTSILWYQIKGSHEDYYMLLRPNGDLVPNKALGLYNGSHQVLLLDESRQRVGFVIYAVRQDDAAKYRLRENRTIELLVYAVSDLRVTVETLNVTESIELENGIPLNLHTEQTNLTITLNLEKTAPESAKVTSTRIFKNGSTETTNLQCTQGGGRWLNRICPIQMNLSRGDYDTTELMLDYLVEGTEPIILMVVTTPAVESVITTGKQVAIGVSVTVSLAVIAVIIGVILYRKKRNKVPPITSVEMAPLVPPTVSPTRERMTDQQREPADQQTEPADQQRGPEANTSGNDSNAADPANTATKASRNGADKRVTEFADYVVPFDERDCPEHTFLVRFTKDELIAKDYPVIGKITNALLNAIGGILILESTDTLTKSERNSWYQRCTDYMKGLVPKKIAASIHFKPSPSGVIMFIPKSKDLMLYNGCIITRSKTGNERNLGYDCLVEIVNMKSNNCLPKQMNDIYHVDDDFFDDEFLHRESQSREYKHWKVTSFGDIINHIASTSEHQRAAEAFHQTLLAMANEPCGGEVIIGITKTQTQGKLLIKGLHLEDTDREEFEDVIDDVLKYDPVTREPRVWREPGRFPEKNTHWRVSYHDVIRTPGNERRVIARIQIDHYPGGVFEVEPAAYDIDQDGYITQKPFAEWRERMERNIPKIPVTGVKTSSRLEAGSIPKAEMKNTKTPDSEARVDDGTSYVKAVHTESKNEALMDRKKLAVDTKTKNAALMHRKGLSFTKDKLNWRERLDEGEIKVEDYVISDSCFDLKSPLNFTPSKETVLRRHPILKVKIEEIEKYHRSERGFVICVKSWMSHLMEKSIPEGHSTDLLVFVQKEGINKGSNFHELHLWVICGTDLWDYAIQTSLSLKQQLIKGGCPGISVICHTLHGDNQKRSSGHQDEIMKYLYTQSEETVDSVKKTLPKILLHKDLYFTNMVGDSALINLTEQQAATLFESDCSRITLIHGPPGSGKTILATCFARYYPQKVLFICTTESFKKYILSSVKCKTWFVKSLAQLKKWIESEGIENIECLIFDDVHNLECTRKDWYTILKQLVQSGKKIHIFADPDIQAYKETNSVKSLKRALLDIDVKCGIKAYQKQLTDVHRNTRKVTAFIKDAVSSSTSPVEIQIKAAHTLDGDDIETLYKGRLRLDGPDNDLVVLIQELTLVYPPRDIAVLLGGKKAVEDKNFYTQVLSQHLDCNVQGADHHPRDGVQVDIVDEYLGLDAPVVIHLNSKPTPTTLIDNPKYKSFIASRGISRVIFLVEKPLNYQDYEQMNLDRPIELDAASTKRGKSSKKATRGLIAAAEAGDVNRVKALLNQGADINGKDGYGFTALGRAAWSGKLEVVKLLLSLGADIEQGSEKPLPQAAGSGHIDTVKCLLQHGADINGEDRLGDTALGRAAGSGELEVVKLLLSLGADTERGERKPLSMAAREGHIDTVQCLLQHGADINGEDYDGRTALGKAAGNGKMEVVKLLLSLDADVERGKIKPLSLAAGYGSIDIIQCLLQHGADINGEDGDGYTALGRAAERGKLEVVKLLLSQGADIEGGRRKPLPRAAANGCIDTVQCLLQHGADINREDGDGHTALGEAAQYGHLEMVKLLLLQAADIERGKRKPLFLAALQGHIDTMQCLLQHGAVINGEDGGGLTALGWAAVHGELEVVKLLLSLGADTERGDDKPLSLAAEYGQIDTVQCLLQHGASQEVKNHALTAALNPQSQFTDKARLKQVIKILRSHGAVADGEQ